MITMAHTYQASFQISSFLKTPVLVEVGWGKEPSISNYYHYPKFYFVKCVYLPL